MKKILSIALALTLIVSMMSVSVFAGTADHPGKDAIVAGDQYWIVGEQGNPSPEGGDELNNGVTTFTPGEVDANIKINFNKNSDNDGVTTPGTDPNNPVGGGDAIEDRYAIDIVYADLVIDLTRLETDATIDTDGDGSDDITVTLTYVWNVNTHKYVEKVVTTPADAQTTNPNEVDDAVQELLTTEYTIDKAFYVINHSSLSIWYNAKTTKTNDEDSINLTLNADGIALENNATNYEIIRAKDGAAANGSGDKHHDLVASPKEDWVTTINALADNDFVTGSVIGTIVVQFAMNDTAVGTQQANP